MSHNNNNDIRIVKRRHWPHLIIATGLFTGYWPWGPGTLAGFVALLIWIALYHLLSPFVLCIATILLILVTLFLGVYTDKVMEQYWGDDPRTVVIDEFFGTWIAALGALFTGNGIFEFSLFGHAVSLSHAALYATIGFILFRIIDIKKLFGCRWFDNNIHGGWGCMLDDALAGFYALIITLVIRYI